MRELAVPGPLIVASWRPASPRGMGPVPNRIARLVVSAATGMPIVGGARTSLCRPPLFAVAGDRWGVSSPEAATAIDVLRGRWTRSSGAEGMLEAFDAADRRLALGEGSHSFGGGTQVSLLAAVYSRREVTLARAGVAGAYLLRAGEMRLLTPRPDPPPLGARAQHAGPAVLSVPSDADDLFALCSLEAGEWISLDELREVLRACPDPAECAPRLARMAEEAGCPRMGVVAFRIGPMFTFAGLPAA